MRTAPKLDEKTIQQLRAGETLTDKTLANYTNHIVDTDIDEAFKPFSWSR